MAKATTSVEYDPLTEAVVVCTLEDLPVILKAQDEARAQRTGVANLTILHADGLDRGEAVAVEGNGSWTPEMIRRLSEAITSTSLRAALNTVAEESPHVVAYDRLLQATESSPFGLRADLASLTRLTRRMFHRRIWPMTARQGMAGGSQMGYRMPRVVAEWWLAATNDGAHDTRQDSAAVSGSSEPPRDRQ